MYLDPKLNTIQSNFSLQSMAGSPLAPAVASLLTAVRPMGYSAVALIRPGPLRDRSEGPRALAYVTLPNLAHHEEHLVRGPGRDDELAFALNLTQNTTIHTWGEAFLDLGFKNALVVRIPVVGRSHYEIVLFSTSNSISDFTTTMAIQTTANSWKFISAAIREHLCPLTARERQSLLAVAEGLNGAEAAEMLNVAERTIRLHVENAKRKLHAANAVQAVFRAHLLCAF